MNPGNSGHRYRMQRVVSVDIAGHDVAVFLECGHDKLFNDADDFTVRWWPDQIGTRERCYDCKAAVGARS